MRGLKFGEGAWYRGNVRRCAERIPIPVRCCLSGRVYLGCHRSVDLARLAEGVASRDRARDDGSPAYLADRDKAGLQIRVEAGLAPGGQSADFVDGQVAVFETILDRYTGDVGRFVLLHGVLTQSGGARQMRVNALDRWQIKREFSCQWYVVEI